MVNDDNNNVVNEGVYKCNLVNVVDDQKTELIDELKQVQSLLDLKTRADSVTTDMELFPKSYQILRQYPILSSRDKLNEFNDDDEEYLENKSAFVRNGFGRLSTVSGKSTGPGAENYNSVDEITIYGNITRKPAPRYHY